MAQRNKKATNKKTTTSTIRMHRPKVTKLEDLSSEIFFCIFDYLKGNDIYKSFYGLNRQFDQIIYNTPNVYLDFTRTSRKFNQSFRQLFSEANIVSVILSMDTRNLVERIFASSVCRRLKSVCLDDVPVYTSQVHLINILNNVKDQVTNLKIGFDSMLSADGKSVIRESFAFIFTELPSLKSLTLSGIHDYFYLTHMDPIIVNNHVTNLTVTVFDYAQWLPLLARLPKLKSLTIRFIFRNEKKRAAPRDSTSYFGCQVQNHLLVEQPVILRHICIYGFNMILENFENLFRLFVTPNLITLKLFDCKRPVIGFRQPKRRPPFLDGTIWHDLTKRYFRSTLKNFHLEYPDVDNVISMTNVTQMEKELMKYHGEDPPCQITCSYHQYREYLAFDFKYIQME